MTLLNTSGPPPPPDRALIRAAAVPRRCSGIDGYHCFIRACREPPSNAGGGRGWSSPTLNSRLDARCFKRMERAQHGCGFAQRTERANSAVSWYQTLRGNLSRLPSLTPRLNSGAKTPGTRALVSLASFLIISDRHHIGWCRTNVATSDAQRTSGKVNSPRAGWECVAYCDRDSPILYALFIFADCFFVRHVHLLHLYAFCGV